MTQYRIQPSESVDRIMSDGTELTRLPYPIIVDQEGFGNIGHDRVRLVGFVYQPQVESLGLYWSDAVRDLTQAIGMYAVIAQDGRWATLVHAVTSAEVI